MLVMRLETAAAKFDRKVAKSLPNGYAFNAADMRELLLEAARRIKELESDPWEGDYYKGKASRDYCGND